MHRSTGMFPRIGTYVDEALILADGVSKEITAGAGLSVLAYFSSDAVGSATVTLSNGEVITVSAPSGGGKVVTSRNEFEVYGVTTAILDASGISAGSVQVSLY